MWLPTTKRILRPLTTCILVFGLVLVLLIVLTRQQQRSMSSSFIKFLEDVHMVIMCVVYVKL